MGEERWADLSFAYIDTHIAVFLHDGLLGEISKSAKREIEARDLLISPMALFELEYLFERGKIGIRGKALYNIIHTDFGVTLCRLAFPRVVDEGLDIGWTSDPFDRLIVAHAKANGGAPLITRDEHIRENYAHAIW